MSKMGAQKAAFQIGPETVVTLTYRLRDRDGNTLEERSARAPTAFIFGLNQVLPALERKIEGQTKGFKASFALSPGDAYGEHQQDLVADVPRDSFPEDLEIQPGMKFDTYDPNGDIITVTIVKVDDEQVTVDGNHPLAGQELHIDVTVMDVRPATPEEVEKKQILPQSKPSFH